LASGAPMLRHANSQPAERPRQVRPAPIGGAGVRARKPQIPPPVMDGAEVAWEASGQREPTRRSEATRSIRDDWPPAQRHTACSPCLSHAGVGGIVPPSSCWGVAVCRCGWDGSSTRVVPEPHCPGPSVVWMRASQALAHAPGETNILRCPLAARPSSESARSQDVTLRCMTCCSSPPRRRRILRT
jgi:hypothetical protein